MPSPWTEEGKLNIEKMGLKIQYPDGYELTLAKKRSTKRKIDSDHQKIESEALKTNTGVEKEETDGKPKRKRSRKESEDFLEWSALDDAVEGIVLPKKTRMDEPVLATNHRSKLFSLEGDDTIPYG